MPPHRMRTLLSVLQLCFLFVFCAGNPVAYVRLYNILLRREGLVILLTRARITSFETSMAVSV